MVCLWGWTCLAFNYLALIFKWVFFFVAKLIIIDAAGSWKIRFACLETATRQPALYSNHLRFTPTSLKTPRKKTLVKAITARISSDSQWMTRVQHEYYFDVNKHVRWERLHEQYVGYIKCRISMWKNIGFISGVMHVKKC